MLILRVNYFMRTTDHAHIQSAQELWSNVLKKKIFIKKLKTNIALG